MIDRGGAQAGDTVAVIDPQGKTLGAAHYSSTSNITLRMVSDRVEPVDRAFFLRRIAAAEKHRRRVVTDSNAYRLVHGEGDLLPGLVIDRYADCFTIQTLDQSMDRAKADIVSVLEELFSPRAVVERNDVAVRKHEDLPLVSGAVLGEAPDKVEIAMNGLKLSADLLKGQKTGVFLDQRENYLATARYGQGQALDCFTSTGGFALHLASFCESVEAADSSATALATAAENREANGIKNIEFREADAFDLLAGYSSARRQFQTVVLDPPAFAKTRNHLEAAMRAYKEINLKAMRLLSPGGVLITCSCSHHVSESGFFEVVASASLDAGRRMRVLERRIQSRDHPILLTVPETLYLKCLVLEVV